MRYGDTVAIDGGELALTSALDGGELLPSINIDGSEIGTTTTISDWPFYTGPYEVTPTQHEQVLFSKDMVLRENVVVNPIPSNYGLITWNGVFINVS